MRVCLVQNTPSPLAQKIPTTCSGAAPPVHLRSDLQGRVDDRVDVVPLTREWVGPALQGQELLRRELELLVRALGDFAAEVLLPDPPKHP